MNAPEKPYPIPDEAETLTAPPDDGEGITYTTPQAL